MPPTCRFSFVGATFFFLSISLFPILQLCARAEPAVAPLWRQLRESEEEKRQGTRAKKRGSLLQGLEQAKSAAGSCCGRRGAGSAAAAASASDAAGDPRGSGELSHLLAGESEELALAKPADETPAYVLYTAVLAALAGYVVLVAAAADDNAKALGLVTAVVAVAIDASIYMLFLGGLLDTSTSVMAAQVVSKTLLAAFGEDHWFIGHCFIYVFFGAPLGWHLVDQLMCKYERPEEDAGQLDALLRGSGRARRRRASSMAAMSRAGRWGVLSSTSRCLARCVRCRASEAEDPERRAALHPGVSLFLITAFFGLDLAFVGPLTADVPRHHVRVFGGSYPQATFGLAALAVVLLGALVHFNLRVAFYRARALSPAEDRFNLGPQLLLVVVTWVVFIVCGAVIHAVAHTWIVFVVCIMGPPIVTSFIYAYGLWASNGFVYVTNPKLRVNAVGSRQRRRCCVGSGRFQDMTFVEAFVRGGATARDYRLALSVFCLIVSVFLLGVVLDTRGDFGWVAWAAVGYTFECIFMTLAACSCIQCSPRMQQARDMKASEVLRKRPEVQHRPLSEINRVVRRHEEETAGGGQPESLEAPGTDESGSPESSDGAANDSAGEQQPGALEGDGVAAAEPWTKILDNDREVNEALRLQSRFAAKFLCGVEQSAAKLVGPLEEQARQQKEAAKQRLHVARERKREREREHDLTTVRQVPLPQAKNVRAVVVRAGSCKVEWDGAEGEHFPPVMSYKIVSSPGGLTLQAGPGERLVTFTGLTSGHTFTFTVTAMPGGKSSAPSEPTTIYAPCPKKLRQRILSNISREEQHAAGERQDALDGLCDVRAALAVESREVAKLRQQDSEPNAQDFEAKWLHAAKTSKVQSSYQRLTALAKSAAAGSENSVGLQRAQEEFNLVKQEHWMMLLLDGGGASPAHLAAGHGHA
eukprot:g7041.t1